MTARVPGRRSSWSAVGWMTGSANAPLAAELAALEALIGQAGGSAHVYGVSSGGMFAFEAAAAGLAIQRLGVDECPTTTTAGATQRNQAYREQLQAALAQGRRGDAVELFMRLAGSSDEDIAGARSSPHWRGLEKLAHTLAYDAACYGPLPADRLATTTQPTLVLTGGGAEFLELAADAVAAAIPGAERVVLEGQGHVADPKAVATVLERFLNG
jgi:pimeloyl-ACP methyl ester carboxylesterase